MTTVREACLFGDFQRVKDLLVGGDDPNECDEKGRNAAHFVSSNGCIDIVKLLQSHHADFEAKDNIGQSPSHVAARWGRTHLLKYFHSLEITIDSPDNEGNTAVHIACEYGKTNCAKWFLEEGFTLDKGNKEGQTPLMILQNDVGEIVYKEDRAQCLEAVQVLLDESHN